MHSSQPLLTADCRAIKVYTESTWLVWWDGVFPRQHGGHLFFVRFFPHPFFCQKCSGAFFATKKVTLKVLGLSGVMVCFRGNGVAWAAWDDLLYVTVALLASGPIHQLQSGHWFRDGRDGFVKKFDDFQSLWWFIFWCAKYLLRWNVNFFCLSCVMHRLGEGAK